MTSQHIPYYYGVPPQNHLNYCVPGILPPFPNYFTHLEEQNRALLMENKDLKN